MSTTSKSHFVWSISLTFTIIICITIICLSISNSAEKQKFSSRSKKQGSLHTEKLTGDNCIPTCDSKECVLHAKRILSYLDSNVDPCINADLFMCGKYKKKFAPDDFDLYDSIEEKMLIELRDILDNIQAEPGSPSWKLKTTYDSCMNISSSELQGSIHFQTFLKNEFGITNWPYLDSDFRFQDSRKSTMLGHVRFFKEFRVFDIEKGKGKNYTYSVCFAGAFVKKHFPLKGAVYALDYFDLSQENIEIILNDFENVNNSIAELYSNLNHHESTSTPVYVNCSNLKDEEWMLLCETMKIYHNEITKFGEDGRRDVIVIKVDDVTLIKNVLSLMDSLSDRSVANYFALKFLWKYLEEINFYFRLTKMKFESREENKLPVQSVKADLFEHCMKWITKKMKLSLAKELFRHYLTTRIVDEVSDLYKGVKADLIKIIDLDYEWILPERKSRIITRVGNLSLNIEIIKNIVENNTFLDDHYKLFHPTSESFFDNEIQYELINIIRGPQRRLVTMTEILMHDEFEVHANTFIESIETLSELDDPANRDRVLAISLNYGMFFPNYFAPNLRRDVNRFTLGLTLGHEIGHNIIHLLGTPISNHTDVAPEFLQLKHCIDKQFSEFKFDILNENLNGSMYSDENLADYFGVLLIDKILDEYDSVPQSQFLLPGLAYSTKQLLYISAFQTSCSKDNLQSEKSYKVDEHAPWKFRTIVASQNSRSYSRLFQCSDGSFMNPKKKCSLHPSS